MYGTKINNVISSNIKIHAYCVYVILIDMYIHAKVLNRQYLHSSNNYALHNTVNICIYKYTLAVFRYYALPILKIYSIHNVNYRFSVLAIVHR